MLYTQEQSNKLRSLLKEKYEPICLTRSNKKGDSFYEDYLIDNDKVIRMCIMPKYNTIDICFYDKSDIIGRKYVYRTVYTLSQFWYLFYLKSMRDINEITPITENAERWVGYLRNAANK